MDVASAIDEEQARVSPLLEGRLQVDKALEP
jgi:hypothetical protein